MKQWIKLAGTGALAVAAALSASAALSGIAGTPERAEEPGIVWPGGSEDAEFILREYNGCIAVFSAAGGRPLTETDIEVRSLREADRALLHAGLPCADGAEVLELLEDLGS